MSKIMRELVAEGRAARGQTTADCDPDVVTASTTAAPWPFAAPVPVDDGAVCLHGILIRSRCYACGRWGDNDIIGG